MTIKSRLAIYPGTFDPFTFGHLDIMYKALNITDCLIVAIAEDNIKNPVFSLSERIEMIKHETKSFSQVVVEPFKGLLANFAIKKRANILIRGLRAISDFEYEFQMSCMNLRLAPEVQTIFLPASENTHFISSRLVKEVSRLNGNVSQIVPSFVEKQLVKKYLAG